MFSHAKRIFSLTASLVVFCEAAAISTANAQIEENVGYYPTFEESGILATGDYDYGRDPSQPLSGPDLDRWASTGGIWPYEYQTGGLSRVQRFFQPVDYILRPVTPGESLVVQGSTSESWLQLAGSFPFLTRTYHRERSTLSDLIGMERTKNIPLFFDVLSISVTAIYTDTNGPGFDESDLEDGFLGALSFSLRGGFAITDRSSIVLGGEVYFLFGNDDSIQFYADAGSLSALASFHYQKQIGSWDIHIFDDVVPFSARNLFYQESYQGSGRQVTGHYTLGIPEELDSSSWWDSRQNYLLNTAGFTTGTFIGESWRLLAGAGRMDRWLFNHWDEHAADEYLNAGIFYDGYGSWIAPSLTYQMHTQDFDDAQQSVNLNAVAPITANITARAGVGYDWGEFYSGYDWNLGFEYQQTDRLKHWVSYSSGYLDSTFGEDFTGTRFEGGTSYQLGPRVSLGAYAGWFIDDEFGSETLHIGASANFALGNYNNIRLIAAYLDNSNDLVTGDPGDATSWLYSATLSRRLATRLNAELTYEYVDSGTGRYIEQALIVRLTRTF